MQSNELSLCLLDTLDSNGGYVLFTSNDGFFDEDAAFRGEDDDTLFASGKRDSMIMKPSPKTRTNAIARLCIDSRYRCILNSRDFLEPRLMLFLLVF